MRGTILQVLWVLSTETTCVLAQAPSGPQIQFAEVLHDFGKVLASAPVRHDFIFTNMGKATLEITDVRPGCQCTTAGTWDRRVEPGKAGKIPIEFNPGRFFGEINKAVATVTCNDPAQGLVTLSVKANIWRPVTIEPEAVHFFGIEGETTNETKKVLILSHLEEPLTLEPPQSSNPGFKPEVKTLVPGKQFELQVTYSPPASNAIPQGVITMKTSHTNLPAITVNAMGMLQPAVFAMPSQLRLAAPPLPENYRQPVSIRNNGSSLIKLSDAVVNAEGVTVQTMETVPGKLFNLNLSFPTNFNPRPGQAIELTVKTTHPRHPILHVPILPTPGARSAIVGPAVARPISK